MKPRQGLSLGKSSVLNSLDEPASKKAQRTIKTFSKQRKADQNSGEDLGEMGSTVGSLTSEPADIELRGQIQKYLNHDKLRRRGEMLRVSFMTGPQGYNEAMNKKQQTDRFLATLRHKIINGRKREDEFTTTTTAIPKLRLNNASFRQLTEAEPSDDVRNLCALVGKKKAPEKDTHSARIQKYQEEMQQLNPAYQRYSKSLSMYILENTLKYTNENIFKHSAYYEKKHNLTRMEFIKIYNLYVSLSFVTIKNKLQKE